MIQSVGAPTLTTVPVPVIARFLVQSFITLHVGVGTFLPVKSQNISHHRMHSESGKISSKTAREINKTKSDGGRIIPVGTTALRLIETAAIDENLISFGP